MTMDFGRTELLNSLVKRINRQFSTTKDDPVEQSLVIGVFGEWGSGKSYLLDAIGKAVNETQKDLPEKSSITLPISFNPWRFEAEEHLIIPLLLTAQSALLAKAKADETLSSKSVGFLKQTARKLELISVAFASAFKGRVGIPGWGHIEFDLDKKRKAFNEESELRTEPDELFTFPQELTSIYYNFHDYLKQVTGRDNEENPHLNLLFLIDDIDRCLPERAVNMMEAIKLFLEVEGCAFVLALDDEVVERGILHRYKDYLFQAQNGESDHFHRPPITGAEYLEKMIHLPVRLPLPTRAQTETFLLNRFSKHFSTQENKAFMEHGEQTSRTGQQFTQNRRELLDLFLEAVPPIPRKLVRTAELLELLIDIAKARGVNDFDPVMLARLVILQLFAPEIYRLGRHHPEMVLTMANWAKEHKGHWRKGQFLKDQLKGVEQKIENDGQDVGEIRYLENVERPLLLLIQKTCQNRSGFDPRVIMFHLDADQLSVELLNRYFSLAEETPAVEALDEQSDERPTAVIDNIAEFIEDLFSAREEVWQAVLGQEALQSRVLDDATFEAILIQYNELGDRAKQQMNNPVWLLHLSDHLTGIQQQRLAKETRLYTQLQEQLTTATQSMVNGTENDTIETGLSLFNEYASVHWGAMLNQQLEGSKQAITVRLLKIIEDGLLVPELRAKVGDTLAQLSDPRFDPEQFYLPTQYQGQAEPHLGFIKIKGGPFMMGSNKDDFGEPRYNEMVDGKAHEVTAINYDYWMARYPTTVAQYGAFIEDGGYTTNEFWGDDGLTWLEKSKSKKQPNGWLEQKTFHNRPVHSVAWFEARAYCRWLNQQLQKQDLPWWPQNSIVRLPTEAEWEKDARADDCRIYPWGSEWDENKLNAEKKLGRVSSVGMYPSGSNQQGLYDLAGNVWEWTHSVLRDYPYQPSKADWQTRQDNDRLVLRGGSWYFDPRCTTCAIRYDLYPGEGKYDDMGFRVVISLTTDL